MKLRISVSIVACARFKASLQSVSKLGEGVVVEPARNGWARQPIFQALVRLGIAHGDVVFAGARQAETRRRPGLGHARAVMDVTGLDVLDDPVMDQLTRLAAPDAFDETDCLAGALRRHWVIPAVFLVQNIAQGVVVLLVARRRDVEAATARKLHAWRHEMQFDVALVCVADPKHIALVGFEPGEGKVLEGVHHLPLLGGVRRVLRREGDDARTIGPLVWTGVDQRAHSVGIAPKHLWQRLAGKQHDVAALVTDRVAVLVVSDDVALDQIVNRPRSAALAVLEEFDQHGAPSLAVNCSRVSDSARSMATRRAATVIASMADNWPCTWAAFSHRAIWLRLPPIRATARTSSGSTLGTERRSPRALGGV